MVDMAHAGGAAVHAEAARRLLGVLELHHRFLDPLPPRPAGPEGGSAQAGPEDGPSLALAAAIPKLPPENHNTDRTGSTRYKTIAAADAEGDEPTTPCPTARLTIPSGHILQSE